MTSPAPLARRAVSVASNSRGDKDRGRDRDHQQGRKQSPADHRVQHSKDQSYHDRDNQHDDDYNEQDNVDETSPQQDNDLYDQDDSDLPPLPISNHSLMDANSTHSDVDEEHDMRRRLMDVESSFMPDLLPNRAPSERPGADDTYLNIKHHPGSDIPPIHEQTEHDMDEEEEEEDEEEVASPPSTPAIQASSPAAAAAERSSMRPEPVRSSSNNDHDLSTAFTRLTLRSNSSKNVTQSSSGWERVHASTSKEHVFSALSKEAALVRSTTAPPKEAQSQDSEPDSFVSNTSASTKPEDVPLPISDTSLLAASSRLKRPTHMSQRNQSHLSVVSAFSTTSDADTEYSTGDYALQTGGAIPEDQSFSHGRPLSRLPSLGSVASAMSRDDSESNRPALTRGSSVLANIRAERALGSLQEEDKISNASDPVTPRPPDKFDFHAPTETVITRHVQNIMVPDTIAKEYRQQYPDISPEKRPASSSNAHGFGNRPGTNLTLKEQNSKIDKLTKENFDLKLKIHFLDQALQNRSEEGIKDMINQNVQLQTDLANERKENQSFRRKIRELEKRLKQLELDLAEARKAAQEAAGIGHEELEYEIFQLTEELDRKTVQITQLTAENMAKEVEKRKMKEYMNAMNQKRDSEHDTAEDESVITPSHSNHTNVLTQMSRKCGKTCLLPRPPVESKPRKKYTSFVKKSSCLKVKRLRKPAKGSTPTE
jgi:hypothetical protein